MLVDVLEDAAAQVRALLITNPGQRPVRATLAIAPGAALRDALDDQPVRADGATVTLELPARGVRWLAVSW